MLTDGAEIAFLDVREHGQYGEGHPFFAVNLPFSKIETLAPRLMPSRAVRAVLMDDGDGVALRAAAVLAAMGYCDLKVLHGGAPAWARAGFTLFKGVNVPSKAFGELVEHRLGTRSISAEELRQLQIRGEKLLLLDGRSAPEFQKMSLPGARSCPNAELGHRIAMLAQDPETTVVINCAGRTRSIIGAQTLALLDLPNPVYALRNGTQGWRLAGFDLVHEARVDPLPIPDAAQAPESRARAEALRTRYDLSVVSGETAQNWLRGTDRSTYLFDVRSPGEYQSSHVANARSAPGGQLVQATDEQLAVRNARIVLCCDTGLRAATTAIWLRGMGHHVWLLDPETPMVGSEGTGPDPLHAQDTMDLAEMKRRVEAGARILDVSPGLGFRAGHIDGAIWATRARLDIAALGDPQGWVLTGTCPLLMAGIANDVAASTGTSFQGIARGTTETWRAAGFDVVQTPGHPSDTDCIDHLFFVHDRHDGNLAAARRYLEWEQGLLDQMDMQERSVLNPLKAVATDTR